MAQKVKDLEKKKKVELHSDLSTQSERLGVDYYNSSGVRPQKEKFGICGTCKRLELVRTKYSIRLAKCGYHDIRISENDPVEECSCYEKVGAMSLNEMSGMAWLIDIPKTVGFDLNPDSFIADGPMGEKIEVHNMEKLFEKSTAERKKKLATGFQPIHRGKR